METQKMKVIVAAIWFLLLISTLFVWTSDRPKDYGSSNSSMIAGEMDILWYNGITLQGETHRISYDASGGPLEIYIVTQDTYNISSGMVPDSYILYHYSNSTILNINGPLPFLYYIVISEVEQIVYVQSWTLSPEAILAEALVYPLAILTGIASIFSIGWYLRAQKSVE